MKKNILKNKSQNVFKSEKKIKSQIEEYQWTTNQELQALIKLFKGIQ